MSNKQYMPGGPIPMLNAMVSGTYQMICEVCRCPQFTTNNGATLYLPHTAGSYDCIEALGARMEFISATGIAGTWQPAITGLENKLRGEQLADMERVLKELKDIRADLREFAVYPSSS